MPLHKHPHDARLQARHLAAGLWLLDPEQQAELRSGVEQATDEQLTNLIPILEEAQKRGDAFLKLIVSQDEAFPQKLRTFLVERFSATQADVESNEKDLVAKLEEEIGQ